MFQLQEDQLQQQNQIIKKNPKNNNIIKFVSWLLVAFCILLIGSAIYSFIYDGVMQHHFVYRNYYLTTSLLVLGLILSFNAILNYTFTILINPGCTSNFFIPVLHEIEQQQQIQQDEGDKKITLKYMKYNYDPQKSQFNNSNLTTILDQSILKFCHACQLPKPKRTHHCSICNKCILKMDHHCPWINNCVGHQNHRHFLLFLTYAWLSTLYFNVINLHITFSNSFIQYVDNRTTIYPTMFIFDIALSIMMTFFCGWNWYLVLSGQTVIEYIDKRAKIIFEKQIIYMNLRQVFGEFNCLFEIFLPSFRNLPSNGVVWNTDYKEQQTKINIDVV